MPKEGGEIHGNTGSNNGGGVGVSGGVFTMSGGTYYTQEFPRFLRRRRVCVRHIHQARRGYHWQYQSGKKK
jgi:hypothetical protein